MSAIGSAAANSAHVLHEHQFLMPSAVVMHDCQHRQLVMDGRPEHAGSVIEIAVALNIDDDAIAALCGERSSHRSRSAVAHSRCALAAQETVGFVVLP